ncbi:MAG TPA: Cj0069 family protein [Tepidisphaeraceae bacterium]|nr:Cj0069 family protein [Tepidisphaeraceae bacterium]
MKCQAAEGRDQRIGILWRGDRAAEVRPLSDECRLHRVFQVLADHQVSAEPVVYCEEASAAVREQLLQLDGVLVWVNPTDGGRDRSDLNQLLRSAADRGVWVSAHPDVILKMGTKEVLHRTQVVGWGDDVHRYNSVDELSLQLRCRLMAGRARVLKQNRGNGGDGVWKVQLAESARDELPTAESRLRVRHALRGCIEEEMSLLAFVDRCQPYFAGGGMMIDQPYQDRLPEGMIRCYLVHDRVVGFGHQATNALFPAPPGAPATAAPQPGPRLYHPPDKPEFQQLKQKLEQEWVPAMQRILDIARRDLPVLWDADFLIGPKASDGGDSYILCEINVSSVFPFPPNALTPLAEAVLNRLNRHP